MTVNTDNVAVVRPKVGGAVWVADSGTTAPIGASEALTSFTGLGWTGEDGVVMTINKEVEDILAFGGDSVITIQTSHDVEFTFKPLEWNEAVATEMFGKDNVDTDAACVRVTSAELPERVYVFDLRGRNGELFRIVVPKAKVTTLGEIPFKHNEPVAAEFTLKAYPDSSEVKVYIYKAVSA